MRITTDQPRHAPLRWISRRWRARHPRPARGESFQTLDQFLWYTERDTRAAQRSRCAALVLGLSRLIHRFRPDRA